MIYKKIICFLVMVCALTITSVGYAQEPSLQLIAESKYFKIYADRSFSISDFLYKIDFDYSVRPESILYRDGGSLEDIIAKTIDGLYLEVSDILDIHVYSFKGLMNIMRGRKEVSSIFYKYYKREMPERGFYLPEKKTLYISSEDVTLGMLGHEIGHAIIGAYFVVPPPAKMQEVLCGYVEYSLLKKRGSLPKEVR